MRARWSEDEARNAIEEWQKSGVSASAFFKDRRDAERARWWLRKLDSPRSDRRRKQPELALLPVHVTQAERDERIAILLRSGHVVKVGRGFSEDVLTRVVAVLEGT
jgi:hypothetical protein